MPDIARETSTSPCTVLPRKWPGDKRKRTLPWRHWSLRTRCLNASFTSFFCPCCIHKKVNPKTQKTKNKKKIKNQKSKIKKKTTSLLSFYQRSFRACTYSPFLPFCLCFSFAYDTIDLLFFPPSVIILLLEPNVFSPKCSAENECPLCWLKRDEWLCGYCEHRTIYLESGGTRLTAENDESPHEYVRKYSGLMDKVS